ncbi:MAG: anti-sigma regulatory factor [Oscillospiraceae bacterium]|jgi:anti-sigma regulatory factor (Ser/Thr protein kinase)|nr:anti-sigma regulatory factor [Oscillospiraceae bacterium]
MSGIREVFPVEAGGFTTAGEASATIKQILKKLGVDAGVVRRVAVASYEVELNLIIHSLGGELLLHVDDHRVRITSQDRGPGIPDIDLAMREGYSTASEDARSLGFGAGMGLPNMKRNADQFAITSDPGVGTCIQMDFNI